MMYNIYIGAKFQWVSDWTKELYTAEVEDIQGDNVKVKFEHVTFKHILTREYFIKDLEAVRAKQLVDFE